MSKSLEAEIQALEQRLGVVPMYRRRRRSQPILEEEVLEEPIVEEEEMGLEEEIAQLEDQLSQDEDIMEYAQDESPLETQEELEDIAEDIVDEDADVIEESVGEGDIGLLESGEDQNTKISRQLIRLAEMLESQTEEEEAEIAQDEEPVGELMHQDLDVVEKIVDSPSTDSGEGGDVLPVVKEETEVSEKDVTASDEIKYASRLKEASHRLDRVSSYLEKKGGKWVKIAYRLDKLADAIDGERRVVAKRVASRLVS